MKVQKVLLPVALTIGLISSANALPIQIDFTGTVNNHHDLLGNVLTAGVAVGDTATGRFVFDDTYLSGLLAYSDPGAGLNRWQDTTFQMEWITATITVNGHTYVVNDLSDFGASEASHSSDQIQIAHNSNYDNAYISEENSKYSSDGYSYRSGHSNISIYGNNYTPTLPAADLSDLNALASLLTGFQFGDVLYDHFYLGETYTRSGYFDGVITSTTISRLDQPTASVPEPSSLALLAAGIVGLGFTRRFNRK